MSEGLRYPGVGDRTCELVLWAAGRAGRAGLREAALLVGELMTA